MGESDAECDDSRTVLTVEVQLKPDSEHRLWLNRNANKNFASSDGGVLPDTEYVFYPGRRDDTVLTVRPHGPASARRRLEKPPEFPAASWVSQPSQ